VARSAILSALALLVSLGTLGYVAFSAATENEPAAVRSEWPEFLQGVYVSHCQEEQGYAPAECACALAELQSRLSFGDYLAMGLVASGTPTASEIVSSQGASLDEFLGQIKERCGIDLLGRPPTPTSDPLEGYELQGEYDAGLRLYDDRMAYGISGFPVLQNSCNWNKFEIEWRTVDESRIQVYAGGWIHSQAEYSQGVPVAELGEILEWDSRGSLTLWGCSQPLFSGPGITDVVVRYSVYGATP